MIVYIENSTASTKKLLDLISEFSKVAQSKVNIQKSMAFLYINNELSERVTKKKIPFTIETIKMKYLEINLSKDMNDLYLGNYRTLRKKLRKIQINGSIYHAHG